MTEAGTQILGREPELAQLEELLASRRNVVLEGGPGIGKTTLWEAGIELEAAHGSHVLRTRPSDAEARLSFAGLVDLLDGVDLAALDDVPAPQRNALDVALYRAEPGAAAPVPHAIALGLLNGLRSLAAGSPVLVAIDDVQWLDPSTAEALGFACRRLRGQDVGFLVTHRSGSPSPLEPALGSPERLEIGPLSVGAIRRLLHERMALSLPRRTLRRVFEISEGNPLYALELGRTLARRGPPTIGEDVPVPDTVEALLGMRVADLPPGLRRCLLALALSADLRASELSAVVGEEALEDAFSAGIALVDRNRVRPSHPLLAEAAKRHSRTSERRQLHSALAAAIADPERSVRHLALATDEPDAELAKALAAAASASQARGARQDAVELAEQALRLTPASSTERADRLLALARHLEQAGEPQRVTDLLTPELDSLPRGAARVQAQLLLSEGGGVKSCADHQRHLEHALVEAGDDAMLRAPVLAKKSIHFAGTCLERIGEAEAWALEAWPAARRAGAETERLVRHGLGWARCLSGRPIDDLQRPSDTASAAAFPILDSLDRLAAVRLVWRGETSKARAGLAELLALADERGEPWSYVVLRLHLCELELRAGELEAASGLLDEWGESLSADRELLVAPSYERCRAILAAGRGLPDETERWAVPALEGSEQTGANWQLLETLRARGIAALLVGEPARAVESLRRVWRHALREGVDDPGALPAAPDLVEALVELGELDEAEAVADRLKKLAQEQDHPWGLATAARCSAIIRLASTTYDAEAAELLEDAAAGYERLGLRFDRARSLLVLGRAQRRRRRWADARRSLEGAAAAFDELGSSGWADLARSELGRVGGRPSRAAGTLTPSERRIAELAAQGLSNKEIAQKLVVTVNTVETHLSHAYSKLGIRTRSQLAGRLTLGA